MTERILIAGIGNIFMGDDAFGVEMAKRLGGKFPESVRVEDFGIRAYDLAYSLMNGYEAAILVDALPRGEAPGTLYVLEPDTENLGAISAESLEGHGLDPMKVLAFVKAMGELPPHVFIVGCEPESLGGENGRMGLSATVEAVLEQGVKMAEALVAKILKPAPASVQRVEQSERSAQKRFAAGGKA